MKKVTLLIAAMLILQSQISAQVTEGYLPDNLGRIVVIADSEGVLQDYHVLFGIDSTGFVKQSDPGGLYKIFGITPAATKLNGSNSLNVSNYFGAPSGHDAIEIRFGDSSHYWISNDLNGGYRSEVKAPFSFYNVGPRPASNPTITGGTKLCFKVIEVDSNRIYAPGDRIVVYGDLAYPLDSAYADLIDSTINPFLSCLYIRYLRFGRADIPYTQTTFTAPDDGAMPPMGSVIRLLAQSSDTSRPWIDLPDTVKALIGNPLTTPIYFYSYEQPVFSLLNAPPGMSIQNNNIIWDPGYSAAGQSYNVTLVASNSFGTTQTLFVAEAHHGITQHQLDGTGNLIRFWVSNDGRIARRYVDGYFGLEYPVGTNYSMLYSGGIYFGGQKIGLSGAPDTINTIDICYETETQPGRILNAGPFHNLIAENYFNNPAFFTLPGNEDFWPSEAPHKPNGDPLKLSARDTWTVFNDIDLSRAGINTTIYGTDPNSLSPGFGIEFQRMTFQFSKYPFNNAVLVWYRIINKSDQTYDSCYVGFYEDPDIGSLASQDLVMVDSINSVLVVYSDSAGWPDPAPTAYGNLLLQGPVIQGTGSDTAKMVVIGENGFQTQYRDNRKNAMVSAAIAIPQPWANPECQRGDITRYDFMRGLDWYGNPKPLGPLDLTLYGRGPADQKTVFSTGPFTFAPNDTQDIWHAMVGGYAPNVTAAKDTVLCFAQLMRSLFYSNMNDFLVDVKDFSGKPKNFTLFPNYPNPFNPSTTIRYELPVNGKVSLKIYNVLGQEVRSLVNTQQSAGMHSVVWDGKNNHGQRVSSGVYLYRLETGEFEKTRKMILIK